MLRCPGSRGVISIGTQNGNAATVAINLRRIMARDDLTFDQVVTATELDERTLRSLASGATHPHARTLHKLAQGLGVSIDELFQPMARPAAQQFDRATNSLVESVVAKHAETFKKWSAADFDELYSRFATGQALTKAGVLMAAESLNAKRKVWRQISVILECGEAQLLTELIALLYRKATTIQPPIQKAASLE